MTMSRMSTTSMVSSSWCTGESSDRRYPVVDTMVAHRIVIKKSATMRVTSANAPPPLFPMLAALGVSRGRFRRRFREEFRVLGLGCWKEALEIRDEIVG